MKGTIIKKIVLAITVLLLPTLASSEETYKFERMWPTLKQPWYFNQPTGIAVDSSGFVYVADGNNRIQKFTSDGQFVAKWGSYGHGDGEFQYPRGIAVDSSGFVYVADYENNRIQKFTSDGQFVDKWGSWGWSSGDIPLTLSFDDYLAPNQFIMFHRQHPF